MVGKIVTAAGGTMTPKNTMKYATHGGGRHAQGEAGVMEGLLLPGDSRREGELAVQPHHLMRLLAETFD